MPLLKPKSNLRQSLVNRPCSYAKRSRELQQSIISSHDRKLIQFAIESINQLEKYGLPGSRATYLQKKINSTYVRIVGDKNPLYVTPVVMKRNDQISHTIDIYIERAAILLPGKLRSTLEKLALRLSGTTLKAINKEHNLITQTGKADNAHLSTRVVNEPTRSSPSSRSCLKVIAIPTRRGKHAYPKKRGIDPPRPYYSQLQL